MCKYGSPLTENPPATKKSCMKIVNTNFQLMIVWMSHLGRGWNYLYQRVGSSSSFTWWVGIIFGYEITQIKKMSSQPIKRDILINSVKANDSDKRPISQVWTQARTKLMKWSRKQTKIIPELSTLGSKDWYLKLDNTNCQFQRVLQSDGQARSWEGDCGGSETSF